MVIRFWLNPLPRLLITMFRLSSFFLLPLKSWKISSRFVIRRITIISGSPLSHCCSVTGRITIRPYITALLLWYRRITIRPYITALLLWHRAYYDTPLRHRFVALVPGVLRYAPTSPLCCSGTGRITIRPYITALLLWYRAYYDTPLHHRLFAGHGTPCPYDLPTGFAFTPTFEIKKSFDCTFTFP